MLADWSTERSSQPRQFSRQPAQLRTQPLDLRAAALAAQDPGAEVLAVVRQETIAALAQAGARACHHLLAIETRRIGPNPDTAASRETLERNVLHRSAPESVCEAGVVDDATAADVYAVMAVQRARSDQVCGKRWFLASAKHCVVSIVIPPVHGGRLYVRPHSAGIERWFRAIPW